MQPASMANARRIYSTPLSVSQRSFSMASRSSSFKVAGMGDILAAYRNTQEFSLPEGAWIDHIALMHVPGSSQQPHGQGNYTITRSGGYVPFYGSFNRLERGVGMVLHPGEGRVWAYTESGILHLDANRPAGWVGAVAMVYIGPHEFERAGRVDIRGMLTAHETFRRAREQLAALVELNVVNELNGRELIRAFRIKRN